MFKAQMFNKSPSYPPKAGQRHCSSCWA